MGQTELVSQVTVLGMLLRLSFSYVSDHYHHSLSLLSVDVPDIASEPVDVRIPQGGSCTLECQAPGKPLPEVKWTKAGKEIKSADHLLIESSPTGEHRLTISNAQADMTGQYVANVKHKLRTQQMIFNVLVTGERNPLPHSIKETSPFLFQLP